MKSIYTDIISHLEKGEKLALGTLVKTKGSTPQVVGASAVFNDRGLLTGTLGGGLIEAEATQLALKIIGNPQSIFKAINLNGKVADPIGAICGGTAVFLLDTQPQKHISVFRQIKASIEKGETGILLSEILFLNDEQVAVSKYWAAGSSPIPEEISKKYDISLDTLNRIIEGKKPQAIEIAEGRQKSLLFAEPVSPTPDLIIVGAGHIGQALCHLGHFSGFEVTVIDNRPELATKERLPDSNQIIIDEISAGFQKINITENSFVVIVTQSHREDTVALAACVQSQAAYIGMIGSKRKIRLIREKFITDGICNIEEFHRIHAPIGIEIHSETVPEIAVSIVAQLIETRRTVKLKTQSTSIYCIILAAGLSTRMKKQKLLLPYKGSSIIETIVSKALASKANNVFVVTGSYKNEIKGKLQSYPTEIVENKFYKSSMLSSVRSGLNAIPSKIGAVLILLGDQPMVKPEVINQLIDNYSKTGKGIILPTFQGKRGHPLLVDLKYRDEINHLQGKIGLRELLVNHPNEILEVEVPYQEILRDIDTSEDYQKEIKQLTGYEGKNSI